MKKAAVGIVVVLALATGAWLIIRHRADSTGAQTVAGTVSRSPQEPTRNSSVPPPAAPGTSVKQTEPASAKADLATPGRPKYPQMKLGDVLTPNNGYVDSVFGVSMTYPENWAVRDAKRWGEYNEQNTVWFLAADSLAMPSMYYQLYPEGAPPVGTNVEAYLRDVASKKEASRRSRPDSDYRNDPESFVFREINGNPSLSYFATFTQNDKVLAEYFIRILGPKGYVMFFVSGPADHVRKIIPTVQQVGGTVRPP